MLELDILRIPFDQVQQFSKTDIAYATNPEQFQDYISHLPTLGAFKQVLDARKAQRDIDRESLVSVLQSQYQALGLASHHITEIRRENQFCVVTAHQPSLLTGPLYFIYKICSAINLARTLEVQYRDFRIHPVMIIGGEDHDFDEINHLHLFGRTFAWQSDKAGGACGRMDIADLSPVLSEIKQVLGSSPYADDLRSLIDECFQAPLSYGQAMQKFVLKLFTGTRLIVLRMDDARLKRQFTRVMKDELLQQTSHDIIEQSQNSLEKHGFKPQAYIREINLFYLTERGRHRIVLNEDQYQIIDTELTFSKEELMDEVDAHPERFSPNVNLRPLYQEMVLPNLAYIGGGGEIAYWLERKSQFEHYEVPFPVLIRRNSVMIVNKGTRKLREKLALTVTDLLEHPDQIIKNWVTQHASHEIELGSERRVIDHAFDDMISKANAVDPTVAKKIEAFKARTLNEVDGLEKRMVRAEKAQHEQNIQRIMKLHEKLFPGNGLQERTENFMTFYLPLGPVLLEKLIEVLDPLQAGMIVLEEQ